MRHLMPVIAASLLVLAVGAGTARADSVGSTASQAVDKVKEGAAAVGKTVTEGAKAAVDAGRRAIATGSQKVHDAVAPAPATSPAPAPAPSISTSPEPAPASVAPVPPAENSGK